MPHPENENGTPGIENGSGPFAPSKKFPFAWIGWLLLGLAIFLMLRG
jgi:hypothetical protein